MLIRHSRIFPLTLALSVGERVDEGRFSPVGESRRDPSMGGKIRSIKRAKYVEGNKNEK